MFECLFSCFGTSKTIIEEPIKSKRELFIEKYTTDFDQIAENDFYNQNIEPLFYDMKEYNSVMKGLNNDTEQMWKRRIMNTDTPSGNVIMFYDSYKMGFTYYCRESIPYAVLNCIAMKYVKLFCCKDFFFDNVMYDSKLYVIHTEPEKQTKPKQKLDGPFIKRKKDEKPIVKDDENDGTKDVNDDEPKEVKPRTINKFIYLGNPLNFSPLQKVKKEITFRAPVIESMKMSYADFKQRKLQQTSSHI
jgi:hypothetical protein